MQKAFSKEREKRRYVMKKFAAFFTAFVLFFSLSLYAAAASGTYNGSVNGNSFSMNYSCSSTNAYCSITCPSAHSAEAKVKPYYLENGSWKWLCQWYSYYNEPGTVATVSWNAGTGRVIGKTLVDGEVNNVYAYGTTVLAD